MVLEQKLTTLDGRIPSNLDDYPLWWNVRRQATDVLKNTTKTKSQQVTKAESVTYLIIVET